uniref:Non-structural protein of 4.8 kDa n=2 Tax=Bovine coronavirus TaxID=11128 RepID=NS48_CVBM|nr:RecName: Full=Non-structural protein of 4.8 kDa; Short=ns4.8; AltName: Full=4.8 kDa accessory protein [Bovine coronavirus Mebus]AAA42912.1 4.8 kDA protein [Bovine coronavirus]AVZ61111.1 4.8 kDa non-structural protein [Bovine coronavirus]UVN12853.1 4.8 kDa protein [Bovine coronavirus]UZN72497.1 4.8 kDa non-structural protein [Bovine coronavirus]BAF75633.1 4.8 kDa protein [Bovine coronavirus]
MPMATTIDGTDYTNIMPSTVSTTVYLGCSIGIDTSTTGFTCFSRY